MADSTIVFLILGGVIALFVVNVLPVEIVAVGTAVALWATGVLELDEAMSGFGDPTVIYIAGLFIVTEALDASGVTTWAGQQLVKHGGSSRRRLLVLTMLLCALVTAVISVNGAVAALLPVVVVAAVRSGVSASRLLMPLAFAAHAGSMLALTGSPVNLIVSEAAKDYGEEPFGFFEFALAGIPLLIGTVAIIATLGTRLLPTRTPRTAAKDLGDHARTLLAHYQLDPNLQHLYDRRTGVVEVVVPPRSAVIGDNAFPGMVTDSGDFVVLAVQRAERELTSPSTTLEAGDTLLLQGTWEAMGPYLDDSDLLVVDPPDSIRRQAVPFGRGARRATVILAAMVVLLATNAVPAAIASLLAAGALIVTRVLSMQEAYRGIAWTTIALVAGMIPLSTAMTASGAADTLADLLVDVVGDAGAYPLLLGVGVLTAALGQLISNTATVLVVTPIALAAATELGVAGRPVLMSLNVVASAALLTPVATPANVMIMGPGGYRFGDYARLGLPLLAWYFVVAIGIVPLIWRL